jgi:hypothetical protein
VAPNRRKQTNIDVALATRPINETLNLRFADNVRRQLFPSTFQSYDELLSYLNLLHSEGKSKAEIEEAVGIKTGQDFSYSKSGGFFLNTRKMAELVPLGLIDHIKEQEAAGIFPPGTAKQYLDDVHRTWNESSKRTQKIAATTAGYWDNGHWVAAKDPKNLGPTTGRNANPEPQKSFIGADGVPIQGNAVHQQIPRANIKQAGLDVLGIPKNWLEDFYEFIMRSPKLNRSGTNMGSGLGRSMTDAEAMSINAGYESPDQLVDRVDKQTQLAAQGVSLEGVNPNDTMAGPVTQKKAPLFPEFSKGKAPKGLMPTKVARNPLMRGARAISRAIPGPVDALIPGVVGGGLALAGGATLPQAAEAFGGGVAGGLSGDLEGAPQPTINMVNVGGELRPLNTDTNTLIDKPGYGLEQSNGQWREVQRGMGAASKQQSKVQADQLIPVPKPVMANTPTGVAQLKAMPKPKNIDLVNEAQYFIINPLQKAFKNVFGNREI